MSFKDDRRQLNFMMETVQTMELGNPGMGRGHQLLAESASGAAKITRKFPKPEISDKEKAKTKSAVKKLFEGMDTGYSVSNVALDYKLMEAVANSVSLTTEELASTPATYLTECINEKRDLAFSWIKSVILEGEEPENKEDEGKPSEGKPTEDETSENKQEGDEGKPAEDKPSEDKPEDEDKPSSDDPFDGLPEVDPNDVTIVDVDDQDKPKEDEPKADTTDIEKRVSNLEEVLEKLVSVMEKLLPLEEKEHGIDLDGDGKTGKAGETDDAKPEDVLLGGEGDDKNTITEAEIAKIADEIAKSVANGVKVDDPKMKTLLDDYRSKVILESSSYGIPDANVKLATKPEHEKGAAQATKKPVSGEILDPSYVANKEASVVPVPALGKSAGLASKNNEGAHGQVAPTSSERMQNAAKVTPLPLEQAYVLLESARRQMKEKAAAAAAAVK